MASGGHQVLNKGFQAAGAITQFRFVELVSGQERQVQQASALNNLVVGVCQETITADDATKGRVANIAMMGVTLVEAGAAITKGAKVRTDAQGRAVALANTAGTVDQVAGIALDDASAAGDWIAILLTPGVTHNPATT